MHLITFLAVNLGFIGYGLSFLLPSSELEEEEQEEFPEDFADEEFELREAEREELGKKILLKAQD